MANEIAVNISIQVNNANLKDQFANGTLYVTQTTQGGPTPGYVTIGTTEESYSFGELATLGWIAFKNLDTTNYVEWGFSTGVYGGKIMPGEEGTFRLKPGTTMYFKANTAACKMIIKAYNS